MVPRLVKAYRWWPTAVWTSNEGRAWIWLDFAYQVVYSQDGKTKRSPWLATEQFGKGYLVHIRLKLRREAQRQ